MSERIIDWPADIKISAQEWELLQPKASARSAFSGAVRNMLIGPPRWSISIDLAHRLASDLARLESTVRQMRNGLNLLRIGDQRRIGRADITGNHPGTWLLNALAYSEDWARWSRIGHAGSIAAGAYMLTRTGGVYAVTDVLPVGRSCVLAVDVLTTYTAAPVLVSISMAGAAFEGRHGEITVDAHARQIIRNTGTRGYGVEPIAGGCRVWLSMDSAAAAPAGVLICASLPHSGAGHVQIARPSVAELVGLTPPAYAATSGGFLWGSVAPRVGAAGQAGDTLLTAGWAMGQKLHAGHWISYGDGMHMLLQDTYADGDGNAALWIEPPIRRSPAAGAPIAYRRVTGLFRLTSSPRIRQEQGILVPGQTLTFEEELQ